MTETVKLPLEEFQKLYAIKIRLETYFSYMEDDRGVLKSIAPTFLDDAKEYIKEYNELTNEKVQNTNNNSINISIFCNCIKCFKHIYKMKQIIDKFLIKRSIRPYKVVPLSTGVIVEHYRNGKLKTEYYGLV